MTPIFKQIVDVFGYHNSNTAERSGYLKSGPNQIIKEHWSFNAMNGMGYFPLLGILIGLFRIKVGIDALKTGEYPKAFAITQMGRGVVEALCLGFLLALPDLIVSIGRAIASYCLPAAAEAA